MFFGESWLLLEGIIRIHCDVGEVVRWVHSWIDWLGLDSLRELWLELLLLGLELNSELGTAVALHLS